MGDARPLLKLDQDLRIARLERMLADERKRRKAAETNAARFHALMLQARVALIVKRDRT